jgi:hypothetical protein
VKIITPLICEASRRARNFSFWHKTGCHVALLSPPRQDRFLPAISCKLAFFADPFDNPIEIAEVLQ